MNASIVFITVPRGQKGTRLARKIVASRLAACVNIQPSVKSVYWWENKIHQDNEALLLVKTRKSLIAKLTSFVRKNHPYSVPEIISVDINTGNKAYLQWLSQETISR